MDGYDALRLTKGGGLTAGTMKPAGDGLHLFLGLGGTGIECLRTLKTRAREWLALSELAEAPFSLFGIDTDDYSRTAGEFLLPLEEKEFLWLRYPGNLGPHLRDRTDLAWLQWNEIPDLETGRPICRQHSRFFLMEHWQELSDRLLDQLQKLRSRAPQLPIFVHVITSMSGLAGSGCFLDLCYLLRKLVEVHGLEKVFLCGWFFLPETILSRIPDSDVSSFRFVSINSYAALRELDYCMNLPENGSSFTQVYKNGMSVPWDRPPVDLACLVGLPEQDTYRGYRKAMENLVQYLMGQLLYPGFAGRIADFQQRAGQAGRTEQMVAVRFMVCFRAMLPWHLYGRYRPIWQRCFLRNGTLCCLTSLPNRTWNSLSVGPSVASISVIFTRRCISGLPRERMTTIFLILTAGKMFGKTVAAICSSTTKIRLPTN